ncbi:MAG TPA: cytochrome c biogenesis protein CcsA [Burkholderiaceae bacterium]
MGLGYTEVVSILLVIATALAALLYGLAWLLATRPVGGAARRLAAGAGGAGLAGAGQDGTGQDGAAAEPGSAPVAGARVDAGSVLVFAALVAHAWALYAAMQAGGGFRFGFAHALSATFWVGVLILWVEGLTVRIDALRTVVLPIAALMCLLPVPFPGSDFAAERAQPLLLPHLIVGTLAYGVLMLAAFHATLMTAAEKALHRAARADASPFARWLESLPPLLVLERILFRFIGVGFVLLTLTALSGIVFSEQVFGRPLRLDHKTVFTIISWFVFAVLLVGRRIRGWRGRTALRLTLAGFTLLLLAYVGTRFVLEVILHRG